MIRTTRMQVITNPTRWGLTPVRVFFGRARPTGSNIVMAGDTVQDREGRIGTFLWRQDESVHVEWEA